MPGDISGNGWKLFFILLGLVITGGQAMCGWLILDHLATRDRVLSIEQNMITRQEIESFITNQAVADNTLIRIQEDVQELKTMMKER